MESHHEAHNEKVSFALDIKDRLLEERKIALNDAWDDVNEWKIRFLNKQIDICEYALEDLWAFSSNSTKNTLTKNAEVTVR